MQAHDATQLQEKGGQGHTCQRSLVGPGATKVRVDKLEVISA